MLSLFKPAASVARDVFRRSSSVSGMARLTAELDAAERVNPVSDVINFQDNGYTALYGLMGPAYTGDGLWECCKGHEQEIMHWTGPHPFKRLQCKQCDHVLCRWCATTEVLTPLSHDPAHQPRTLFAVNDHSLYGQVCPACGLSHRARPVSTQSHILNDRIVSLKDLQCPCGLLSSPAWLQFKLGSIDNYRRNPYEASSILTSHRAENSIRSRRASSDRHALRSASSLAVPLPSSCASSAQAQAQAQADAEAEPDTPPETWSLRLHEQDWRQDFIGTRPWHAPAYVLATGMGEQRLLSS